MKFDYKVGNVLDHVPSNSNKLLIPHIVNDEFHGTLGAGIAMALAKKWPTVKSDYHNWAENPTRKNPFKLGRNQYVIVEPNIIVVNMVAQSDCGGYKGFAPIRYQSLEECLMRIEHIISKKSDIEVATGLIGSGLAGGSWFKITEIVDRVFKNIDIEWTWYCLTQEELDEAESNDATKSNPPYPLMKDTFSRENYPIHE
jgi:hypothetical protein